MSNIIERLGLANEVKEINLGKSFSNGGGGSYFHTFRYDFKPASVDVKKMAAVDIGERHQVTVSVPHIDKGSGTTHAVFKGSKKPYNKECVLIIDHRTGDITLEKLTYNVQLKKTRAEGTSKIKQNVLENNFNSSTTKKLSPVQKNSSKEKSSNSKFSNWTSNHFTPAPKCSPLPKSPNSQSSPPNRTSPSVPNVVPPSSNLDFKHSSQAAPDTTSNKLKADAAMDEPEIEMLSSSSDDSSGDESSASSSSGSESSENETMANSTAMSSLPGSSNTQNLSASSSKLMPCSQPASDGILSMPKFSQLSEDLELSDSDSD